MGSIFREIANIEDQAINAVLCFITKTSGSVPRKTGAKMIVTETGKTVGSLGGGSFEKEVIKQAYQILKSKQPQIFHHALVTDHGMCCGGKVDVYIEPIMTLKNLYIFGAGHIGKALGHYAADFGFRITYIDERSEMMDEIDGSRYNLINQHHEKAFQKLRFNEETFIAVITHDHSYDREIVAYCANQPHAYLGMIGSRRKIEMAKKVFRGQGSVSEEKINQIDWPMGLAINTETPEEIAISILAKLIHRKNALAGKITTQKWETPQDSQKQT